MSDLFENPMGLCGFEFVEFAAKKRGILEPVFETAGFTHVASHRSKQVELYRQGDINLIINYEPKSLAYYFADEHGPSACGLAFRVKDAKLAYERALELGQAYAGERKIFGKSVSDFQINRHALGDARTELDMAWLLMLRGAQLLDQGYRVSAEASMAKLASSEICGRIVDRMLQLHGGNGYSREYEIERLYRDARVMRIYEGTSEVQREIISNWTLDKQFSG